MQPQHFLWLLTTYATVKSLIIKIISVHFCAHARACIIEITPMTRVPSPKQANNRAGSSGFVRRSEVSSPRPSRDRYVTTTRRGIYQRSHTVTLHCFTTSYIKLLVVSTVANIATGYLLTNFCNILWRFIVPRTCYCRFQCYKCPTIAAIANNL